METSYQEYTPSEMLQPYVDCYWYHSFYGEEESIPQRCVPLGTIEIIIRTNDHCCYVNVDNEWQKLPDAFVCGMYRDAVTWKTIGPSQSFGIRLKPETLLQLFKIPPSVLFCSFTSLDTFFGKIMSDLTNQIYEAQNMGSRIAIAENFLLNQLKNTTDQRNYLFEATKLIRTTKGNISIDDLSSKLYVSSRQLQRSFKEHLGTGPKTFLRIIRFRNAYEYVQQTGNKRSWINAAYDFGYADQAHFIRDFKEFTGEAPTHFVDKEDYFYQMNSREYNTYLQEY